jgi:hypothetical protein
VLEANGGRTLGYSKMVPCPAHVLRVHARRPAMNYQKKTADNRFTQTTFPDCHHLCLIYDSEEERRKIVSEFLATGIRQGELVRYFADTTSPDEIRTWLTGAGVEIQKVEGNGTFGITKAESAYCPSGRFVPQEVIENMVSRYAMARDAGYRGSRACGEMSWVFGDTPGADRFLEYEVRINMITETFPYIGMCQYDARLFDGASLFNILQVHPYMIAQGQIVRNPYYIKPEEFLAKLES